MKAFSAGTTNGFNLRIFDSLMESTGIGLTWFDCNLQFTSGSADTTVRNWYRRNQLPKKIIQAAQIIFFSLLAFFRGYAGRFYMGLFSLLSDNVFKTTPALLL